MSTPAYIRSASVVSADMDGEPVIMSLEKNAYFGITGIGSVVWEMLEGPQRIDDLVNRICADYEVSPETCRRDVTRLLQDLEQNGLIEAS